MQNITAALATIGDEPSKVTVEQYVKVEATKVRVGNIIDGEVVVEVKRGSKYVKVWSAERMLLQVDISAEIGVTHTVETEESKTARTDYIYNFVILQSASKHVANSGQIAALAKLQANADKGYTASSFDTAALLEAQATDDVQARWVDALDHLLGEGHDAKAARDIYVADLKEDLVASYDGGLSRSTSVVSNIMEDARDAAIRTFIRRGGSY